MTDVNKTNTPWVTECLEDGFFSHCYLATGAFGSKPQVSNLARNLSTGRIFDLASLTKALVTAPLVYFYCTKGCLSIDQRFSYYLPHLLPQPFDRMTIHDLLAHRSGLPPWRNFWINRLDTSSPRFMQRKERLDLVSDVLKRVDLKPEAGEAYSDIGFIALGILLEKIMAKDLNEAFMEFCEQELAYSSDEWGFAPDIVSQDFISTGTCALRKRALVGEVHDENCAALGSIAGHAGLFSSGNALLGYLESLSRHPKMSRFLSLNAQAAMDGHPMFGLRVGDDPSSSPFGNGHAIGHLGFTGTAFWLDWNRQIYGLVLSNRVVSGRVNPRIKTFRKEAFSFLQSIHHDS
ncbi:serine hydrolase domain-containing protein [Pseudobacteriovorax antillogorgiicola]|uniref:CubicO group peptidase, beta-lactamase class C family n=1 Tax=Pseudobacteriovorax antillogorgiicola TaxID=1513793 RepID=A0A1Y6B4C5_9BACT|nr:serine hydrolase [Pseudobacteriovorax antillogorgiicola]TCS59139.1 CubicO group peptidase (beta-lactamase class C family) [Pseudobacteriovorax antillogorgiicola]SME91284.1 CubicO group peptidase, beta-lactamase class C family [Pseudobacteriovorax antillogorgiicola]